MRILAGMVLEPGALVVTAIVTRKWKSEKEFQRWIVDTFTFHGWKVLHVPTPMRPTQGGRFVPDSRGRGLPDLLLVHDDPPRVYWAECKAVDGVMSETQIQVLGLLRGVCDVIRDRFAPSPSPVKVFVFQPGTETLIEDLARGAML